MAADIGDVLDGCGQTRETFVVLRAGFPAVRQLLCAGTQLVRTQPLQLLALAVKDPEVRTEELVTRAGEKVAIQRAHVNRTVRRVVYRIDERHRAGCMRQPHNLVHVAHGSYGISCPTDGYQTRVTADLRRQVEHVKRAIAWVDVGSTHFHPALLKTNPGRDVRVMVQTRDQQFVPALQFAANGTAQGEGERRHVSAEDDLVSGAVEEVGHCRTGIGNHLVSSTAGDKSTTRVRVAGRKVIRDGINDTLRDLCSARSIEEDCGMAVHALLKRGKLLPHPRDVQLGRTLDDSCTRRHNLCTPYRRYEIGEQAVSSCLWPWVALADDELGKNVGFEADEQRGTRNRAQRIRSEER